MNKYIIIPGCSDLNRGDQALVWETRRIAEKAGFKGEFFLTCENNEPVIQSENKKFKVISPLLEHPSRKYKNKENIQYTKGLKLKWGVVALGDFLESFLILNNTTRKIYKKIINDRKRKVLDIFEDCDAIFMKGGGVLQTYGGWTSTYSMYYWIYPIILAHKMKKPVYIMPNSFGPFEGPFVKSLTRWALKRCRLVTTRETLSQKMVEKELNLKVNNYADLAFRLPTSNIYKEEIFARFDLPQDRKLVAITMRPFRFPNSKNPKEAYSNYKKELAKFIEWLYGQGMMPVIIEHTLAVNTHENDGACISEVTNMVEKDHYRIISDKTYDCEDLKCIYSFCNYIIGTRFHSVIFSFSCGIPGIAIAYTGNKSQGIMNDMGLNDLVLHISEVNHELLKKKFTFLLDNENEVSQKIKKYMNNTERSEKMLTEELIKLK